MYARRSGLWLAIAAGAGACERCTWQLEYVEPETTSGAGTSTGSGSSGEATRDATGTGAPDDSTAASSGVAGLDLGGAQSGSSDATEGPSASDTGLEGSSSSEGSGQSGGGPPTDCGDDIIDVGEACDDGNLEDDDECPSGQGGCVAAATCGDGFVWAGVEQCDDGDDQDADECSNDCLAPRTVFVTEKVYYGHELGGALKAGWECQDAALKAKLSGKFRAWLSEGGAGPSSKLDSEGFAGWYRLVNGKGLAHGWGELTSGGYLATSISVTEFGKEPSVLDSPYVWTGTNSDGSAYLAGDCGSWEDGTSTGRVGTYSAENVKWTSYQTAVCDSVVAHLYCFEVSPLLFP